jgi:diguanylate cyclase (GGDEF)-like protein
MSDNALFEKEQRLISDTENALINANINPDNFELHCLLANLLENYKKLLKQTQRLVNLNDRYATKLHQDNADLKKYSESLKYFASYDALTGLLNKATITKTIRRELKNSDLLLMLFDVDHFKNVNDTYGHYVGDLVLGGIGEIIRESLRDQDQLGRLGGEEFIVALNYHSAEEALEIAERLRKTVQATELVNDGDVLVKVTVSIGVTLAKQGESFEEVYNRVDKLMYCAKQNGRNRVENDLPSA